jgi:hypothetical protein
MIRSEALEELRPSQSRVLFKRFGTRNYLHHGIGPTEL